MSYYLTEAFSGLDGDEKLLPRATLEDPCTEEFVAEAGSTDATVPWFDIANPPAWEPWYPWERKSGFDAVVSQRSKGLQWHIWQQKQLVLQFLEQQNIRCTEDMKEPDTKLKKSIWEKWVAVLLKTDTIMLLSTKTYVSGGPSFRLFGKTCDRASAWELCGWIGFASWLSFFKK